MLFNSMNSDTLDIIKSEIGLNYISKDIPLRIIEKGYGYNKKIYLYATALNLKEVWLNKKEMNKRKQLVTVDKKSGKWRVNITDLRSKIEMSIADVIEDEKKVKEKKKQREIMDSIKGRKKDRILCGMPENTNRYVFKFEGRQYPAELSLALNTDNYNEDTIKDEVSIQMRLPYDVAEKLSNSYFWKMLINFVENDKNPDELLLPSTTD